MAIPKAYSIGFTGSSAAHFFGRLKQHGIQKLLDVRINNTSQLAAFAKRADLEFFLNELVGAKYQHEPLLAPTEELLKAYRNKEIRWLEYEAKFLELMQERQIEKLFCAKDFLDKTVLLCSEATPLQCHRRLVLDYLNVAWNGLEIVHL
jgi:uncharacterized protein (DUF488 family)